MSTRTVIRPYPVISDGNMASNITSAVTILQSLTKASYDIAWSGTSPVGTVAVQVSNDYSVDPTGAVDDMGNWTPLELETSGTIVTSLPVSGNSGTIFINLSDMAAYAVRAVYTAGSGTGTMNATFVGKVS